jgi:PAS domain S-box-containing protein
MPIQLRVLILSIMLLTFSSLGIPPARADVRTVTVGVYENAPKIFTNTAGKPSGIFIDIIEQIAKKEGWKLRYVHGTWAEGLDRLAKGEIDLMPDVAYTTERENVYSFHKVPVLFGWSQVYARKGSGIQSILNLNGKRVVALEQTIQLETFQRLANSFELKITLIPVPDYKTGFEMIANGKADAVVTNRFYGLMNARKFGLEDTPVMFDPAPFFFAAPLNAPRDLLDIIDRHLSEMKKDPRSAYYAALKRWTSEEVQFKLPPWMQIVGLVLGVVLLMSLAGSLVLKRQVTARTRELKQINDDLRTSEQRYRHLFEHNPAPMLIYQRGTLEMLAVNDAFVNHYGYSREEALNLILTDLYPDDEKELIAKTAAGLKGHAYVGEWHHRKADGAIITIMVRSHDIDYWGHNARIAVISDITETKRMEAELRHINETLDQKVRERTVELEHKNDELEAANERLTEVDRLKSMFIASMSHELRTPLNSVIGYSSVILNEWLGPVGPEQKEKLAIVLRAGKHLLSLINDVIDVSKIEAGQLDVFVEEFDLFDLVAEAAHQLEPDMRGKGLAFSADSVHARLRTDRRRLLQALLNLLSNAMKYTVEGTVRLSVRLDDQWAEIAVQDTGIGIGDQDADKIFKPFVRVDSPLRGTVPGTGLGLYLTHKLVSDILKGAVSFTSQAGQGSTFTIRVPVDVGNNSNMKERSALS